MRRNSENDTRERKMYIKRDRFIYCLVIDMCCVEIIGEGKKRAGSLEIFFFGREENGHPKNILYLLGIFESLLL